MNLNVLRVSLRTSRQHRSVSPFSYVSMLLEFVLFSCYQNSHFVQLNKFCQNESQDLQLIAYWVALNLSFLEHVCFLPQVYLLLFVECAA